MGNLDRALDAKHSSMLDVEACKFRKDMCHVVVDNFGQDYWAKIVRFYILELTQTDQDTLAKLGQPEPSGPAAGRLSDVCVAVSWEGFDGSSMK